MADVRENIAVKWIFEDQASGEMSAAARRIQRTQNMLAQRESAAQRYRLQQEIDRRSTGLNASVTRSMAGRLGLVGAGVAVDRVFSDLADKIEAGEIQSIRQFGEAIGTSLLDAWKKLPVFGTLTRYATMGVDALTGGTMSQEREQQRAQAASKANLERQSRLGDFMRGLDDDKESRIDRLDRQLRSEASEHVRGLIAADDENWVKVRDELSAAISERIERERKREQEKNDEAERKIREDANIQVVDMIRAATARSQEAILGQSILSASDAEAVSLQLSHDLKRLTEERDRLLQQIPTETTTENRLRAEAAIGDASFHDEQLLRAQAAAELEAIREREQKEREASSRREARRMEDERRDAIRSRLDELRDEQLTLQEGFEERFGGSSSISSLRSRLRDINDEASARFTTRADGVSLTEGRFLRSGTYGADQSGIDRRFEEQKQVIQQQLIVLEDIRRIQEDLSRQLTSNANQTTVVIGDI